MSSYNEFPKNAYKLDSNSETFYQDMLDFFTFCHTEESRSPLYNSKTILAGMFSARLYPVCGEPHLGYAIKQDWKAEEITFWKYGTPEEWSTFKSTFASKFKGDNS